VKIVTLNLIIFLFFYLQPELQDYKKLNSLWHKISNAQSKIASISEQIINAKGGIIAGKKVENEDEFWKKLSELKSKRQKLGEQVKLWQKEASSLELKLKQNVKAKLIKLEEIAHSNNFVVIHSPFSLYTPQTEEFIRLTGIDPEKVKQYEFKLNEAISKIMFGNIKHQNKRGDQNR